jgi:DNA-binding IclR family transcriptional regulator
MAKPPLKTVTALTQTLAENQLLSPDSEDCKLSVDPEVFGRGKVEVDSEYDLELGRPGMGHLRLLTAPNKIVRW